MGLVGARALDATDVNIETEYDARRRKARTEVAVFTESQPWRALQLEWREWRMNPAQWFAMVNLKQDHKIVPN